MGGKEQRPKLRHRSCRRSRSLTESLSVSVAVTLTSPTSLLSVALTVPLFASSITARREAVEWRMPRNLGSFGGSVDHSERLCSTALPSPLCCCLVQPFTIAVSTR